MELRRPDWYGQPPEWEREWAGWRVEASVRPREFHRWWLDLEPGPAARVRADPAVRDWLAVGRTLDEAAATREPEQAHAFYLWLRELPEVCAHAREYEDLDRVYELGLAFELTDQVECVADTPDLYLWFAGPRERLLDSLGGTARFDARALFETGRAVHEALVVVGTQGPLEFYLYCQELTADEEDPLLAVPELLTAYRQGLVAEAGHRIRLGRDEFAAWCRELEPEWLAVVEAADVAEQQPAGSGH